MYINENKYNIENNIGILYIKSKYGTINSKFDIEDELILKQYQWHLKKTRNKFYIVTIQKNTRKTLRLHNILMNYQYDNIHEIDHIDGDSLNNQKKNLRLVERLKNIYNSSVRSDNITTKIRGVSFNSKHKKYIIDFAYNKYRFYFKSFSILEEAVYLRYLCEYYFLKEYRCISNDELILSLINKLSENQKNDAISYFQNKIKGKI